MQDGALDYLLVVEVQFPNKRTITVPFDVPAGPGATEEETDKMAIQNARDFVQAEVNRRAAASLTAHLYKQIPSKA